MSFSSAKPNPSIFKQLRSGEVLHPPSSSSTQKSTTATQSSSSSLYRQTSPSSHLCGVWQKHKDNLILMERYHFFSSSCRQFQHHYKSLSELNSDENELDGALATVLGVLKKIHAQFFDTGNGDDYAARDVRQVRKRVRKEVLSNCTIVFSRVIPNEVAAHEHPLWKMAVQLGATCTIDLGESVTHVVSPETGTSKSRWAVKEGKFLVHPRWLEASSYLWQRQPEDKFPANTSTRKTQ